MNEKKDCVMIETDFMKGIISGLVHKALEKKGYDADVQLNDIAVENRAGKLHVHLNVDTEISTRDLEKLLKNYVA